MNKKWTADDPVGKRGGGLDARRLFLFIAIKPCRFAPTADGVRLRSMPIPHSYRNASIGSNREAFHAG